MKDFNSNEFNTKVDEVMANHVSELVNTMNDIKKTLYKSMVSNGYFEKNPESTRTFYIAIGVFGLMTGNLMLFIVALIFGRIMPRKTRSGAESVNVAKSLRIVTRKLAMLLAVVITPLSFTL